jgi:hypothetical protein
MLPKIVCQSTDLDVVKKELVDAEQSMWKYESALLSIHYFLVSSSESTPKLLFTPISACWLHRSKETIDYFQESFDLN